MRFGPFVLDRQRAELMRGGIAVPLRPKAFTLLSLFAARPSRVLSKEELLDAAWPGVVVTEDSLTQCVHELRTALGDAGPVMLRTVPRRGYRLDAEVIPDPAPSAPDLSAASVPPGSAAPRASGWRERLLGWFGAALTLALMAGLAVFAVLRPPAQPPLGVSARPPLSIIVLPLVNARGESDWFSDALSNDLTFELGQVPGAFVISRDTAFTYKGKVVDPRAAARDLGVRYVVQGSVQRESERVRLRLSMVDGETGALQWSQEFDSDRAGLPASLADTAQQVARSLSVQMYRSTGARAAALSPDQVQADDLAMQGWAVWFRGFTPENLREAGRLFDAAVRRDPGSIRGWGGVAVVNGTGAAINWVPDKAAAMTRLQQASDRLQVLDADDFLTYLARSNIANLNGDNEGRLLIGTAMIERFPSHPQSHFTRAQALANLGRFDECVEPAKRAVRLGPRDYFAGIWNWQIGTCQFMRGDYRQAAQFARAAQQTGPRLPLPPLLLAASLARDGDTNQARRVVADYRARFPDYKTSEIELIMRSRHPAYVEGRTRMIETLRELGMP